MKKRNAIFVVKTRGLVQEIPKTLQTTVTTLATCDVVDDVVRSSDRL